ncbi:major phage capsid protein N precursor [Pectobacterium atrosepticum SCRI1043]|uniref:Major phage capsid protein N n=1 Tax=Pectobacterium atrosepticum (strain SCRI 1043 / ATCC BAA-672) TaxID=218491 RepID=Q6D3X2_PECAS|nr:phage major capsid protein, P2 family [Pectobacterium atrosepticum]MCL6315390.1 phage major capsid protein, P2 family [Pectobacterium atrosepticum]MCL6320375.1 phage major capsid protein, P2 family [Pectobacterium atrosepticum]CAG75522.1 major phage capsid protein N precursor [Pectobacterium atrosepticum SCRI1043]
MENITRQLFDQYVARQAQLNGVSSAAIAAKFAVDPTVQQRLESAAQESDTFLRKINVFGVTQQIGQKVLIGSKGPMAGVNNGTTVRRNPGMNHTMEPFNYTCRKVNYDYGISYEQLDAWAHQPNFQPLISSAMARQMSLDRIMIGFNGTSYADPSDRAANPLLQDCGVGWLQKIRTEASHRRISDVTITARDEDNKVIAKGTYGNLSAAVYDAKNSLMDEWHKRNPDNVVILAGDLLTTSNFPAINAMSQTNPNSEMLAGQLIVAQERVGNMPTFIAPYFPVSGVLITPFKNLSVYYQRGGLRRTIKEESEYNRIATYQSSNDDFVIEDYGNVAFIDGITFAQAGNGGE